MLDVIEFKGRNVKSQSVEQKCIRVLWTEPLLWGGVKRGVQRWTKLQAGRPFPKRTHVMQYLQACGAVLWTWFSTRVSGSQVQAPHCRSQRPGDRRLSAEKSQDWMSPSSVSPKRYGVVLPDAPQRLLEAGTQNTAALCLLSGPALLALLKFQSGMAETALQPPQDVAKADPCRRYCRVNAS